MRSEEEEERMKKRRRRNLGLEFMFGSMEFIFGTPLLFGTLGFVG